MADFATSFHGFVELCGQRESLISVQSWVEAHDQLDPAVAASKEIAKSTGVHSPLSLMAQAGVEAHDQQLIAKSTTPRAQYSARNDVRTSAGVSGAGINMRFPPGSSSISDYNIFADIALHDQAAATIASASQRKSGFTATMSMEEGVARERFIAYLHDFIAPHWLMSYYKEQTVRHESLNHGKFVDDLVNIVVEGLRAVGGDADSAKKAEESVRSLSKRLSSSNTREEKLTLFSNFWMKRPNSTDPVVYGIFYTTLQARYVQNGKTEIISTSTTTYSVVFSLLSGVLIANAKAYNALLKQSVDDWLDGHKI